MAYHTIDFYFSIDDWIGIFQNYPGTIGCGSEIEESLNGKRVPKRFYQINPVAKNFLSKLEKDLKESYKLEDISELDNRATLRDMNIGGVRVWTGLGKFSFDKSFGYHLRINYIK